MFSRRASSDNNSAVMTDYNDGKISFFSCIVTCTSRGSIYETRVASFFSVKHTNTRENVPNYHIIYQTAKKITKGR
jgi:hypothetical protein